MTPEEHLRRADYLAEQVDEVIYVVEGSTDSMSPESKDYLRLLVAQASLHTQLAKVYVALQWYPRGK